MNLAVLERHPHAAAVLGPAADGRPSHAYLLHGPAGSGKREAARAVAAELLARDAADPESARKRARHGVHPDLTCSDGTYYILPIEQWASHRMNICRADAA